MEMNGPQRLELPGTCLQLLQALPQRSRFGAVVTVNGV